MYRINEGGWLLYSIPYEVSGEQIHTTELAVRDIAGNLGKVTLGIKIDMTPPTTTVSIAGNVTGVNEYSGSVTITLTGDDPTSGIETTWYKLDGADPVLYTIPFTVSDYGTHTLEVYSSNRAGLVETSQTHTFTIDGTPPQLSNVRAECELGDLDAPYINIYAQAQDGQSGLARAYLIVSPDGQPPITFSEGYTFNGQTTRQNIPFFYNVGTLVAHTIEVVVVDVAGNESRSRLVCDLSGVQARILEASATHTPTATMTRTPTPTPTDTPTNTSTPTSTHTPTATVTGTLSPTPTGTLSATPSLTHTSTATATNTATAIAQADDDAQLSLLAIGADLDDDLDDDEPSETPQPSPTWTLAPLIIAPAIGAPTTPPIARDLTPVDPNSQEGIDILAALAMATVASAGAAYAMQTSASAKRRQEELDAQYQAEQEALRIAQAGQVAVANANMAQNQAQVTAGKQQVVMEWKQSEANKRYHAEREYRRGQELQYLAQVRAQRQQWEAHQQAIREEQARLQAQRAQASQRIVQNQVTSNNTNALGRFITGIVQAGTSAVQALLDRARTVAQERELNSKYARAASELKRLDAEIARLSEENSKIQNRNISQLKVDQLTTNQEIINYQSKRIFKKENVKNNHRVYYQGSVSDPSNDDSQNELNIDPRLAASVIVYTFQDGTPSADGSTCIPGQIPGTFSMGVMGESGFWTHDHYTWISGPYAEYVRTGNRSLAEQISIDIPIDNADAKEILSRYGCIEFRGANGTIALRGDELALDSNSPNGTIKIINHELRNISVPVQESQVIPTDSNDGNDILNYVYIPSEFDMNGIIGTGRDRDGLTIQGTSTGIVHDNLQIGQAEIVWDLTKHKLDLTEEEKPGIPTRPTNGSEPINRGDSGSGWFNKDGELVGITTGNTPAYGNSALHGYHEIFSPIYRTDNLVDDETP